MCQIVQDRVCFNATAAQCNLFSISRYSKTAYELPPATIHPTRQSEFPWFPQAGAWEPGCGNRRVKRRLDSTVEMNTWESIPRCAGLFLQRAVTNGADEQIRPLGSGRRIAGKKPGDRHYGRASLAHAATPATSESAWPQAARQLTEINIPAHRLRKLSDFRLPNSHEFSD